MTLITPDGNTQAIFHPDYTRSPLGPNVPQYTIEGLAALIDSDIDSLTVCTIGNTRLIYNHTCTSPQNNHASALSPFSTPICGSVLLASFDETFDAYDS